MSLQRDLPESMAWRVIGRLESGQTQRSVADAVGVARSVVARLWNRFKKQEMDRGTRNNPAFVRERSQYKRAGWMVWGGISIGGRTDLHIIRNGTLTGRRYADKILRPHVIPYAGAIGDSFVFQDDNARPHRSRLVENMLEAETIQRMEWTACSPDLNQSSMFGICSDDALLRDQGRMLRSETWRLHFLRSGTVFPKV
ncbi:transposable element Tcb2 transposase [Trichonephila clavipes]|nr:transposable element Tcb2 transposase [Trichonephila clavipes]